MGWARLQGWQESIFGNMPYGASASPEGLQALAVSTGRGSSELGRCV